MADQYAHLHIPHSTSLHAVHPYISACSTSLHLCMQYIPTLCIKGVDKGGARGLKPPQFLRFIILLYIVVWGENIQLFAYTRLTTSQPLANLSTPLCIASFPGLLRLQFLIACSMQKRREKALGLGNFITWSAARLTSRILDATAYSHS